MTISLTKISSNHLTILKNWRNSSELWKFNNQYILLNMENQKRWFEQISKDNNCIMYMISFRKKIVGICGLINIEGRQGEISIIIGVTNLHKKGIGKKALKEVLKIGFEKLNLHRIEAKIFDFNINSKKFFKSIGFMYEFTLRENFWRFGKWNNVEVYSILVNEYKGNNI